MKNASKKLIVFIPSIEDGGVEKNLFLILNYLSLKLKNIILITFDNKSKKKIRKNINIINPFFNFSFIKGRYSKYIFCLIVLAKILLFNRNYTVLSFQANIFVIILSKFFGISVISRSNSSSTGWSKNPFKQMIFSHYFKLTDEIIVNSFKFKKEMDERYNINCKCILNPFDFKKISKKSKFKVKKIYNKKSIKLISIGRLTTQKDFLTILKAMKILKNKNIELAILGKGEEEKNLQKFIDQNNLKNKVKLLGYKQNPFPYIKQADIFLLSSIFEGSPNVLVEALYLKKYIISTNCPTGPAEILNKGKYGQLVKIGDFKSIAKAIIKYKKNKYYKKKIIKGHKSLSIFSYKKNTIKYLNLINEYL